MNDLQEFFLTKNLNTDEREALSLLLPPPKKFKKGETVYSRDNFLKAVGVVVKGKVTAETCEDERVVMRTLSAGEAFGVSAVFSGEENFVSNVIAADECEIIFLDEQILLKIFEKFPQTVVEYIGLLSSKIRFLNRKISLLSAKSVTKRVYEYLLTLCNEESVAILPKMTVVCKTLGIGRSSLYRSFDLLTDEGLIEKRENLVKVIDYEKNS